MYNDLSTATFTWNYVDPLDTQGRLNLRKGAKALTQNMQNIVPKITIATYSNISTNKPGIAPGFDPIEKAVWGQIRAPVIDSQSFLNPADIEIMGASMDNPISSYQFKVKNNLTFERGSMKANLEPNFLDVYKSYLNPTVDPDTVDRVNKIKKFLNANEFSRYMENIQLDSKDIATFTARPFTWDNTQKAYKEADKPVRTMANVNQTPSAAKTIAFDILRQTQLEMKHDTDIRPNRPPLFEFKAPQISRRLPYREKLPPPKRMKLNPNGEFEEFEEPPLEGFSIFEQSSEPMDIQDFDFMPPDMLAEAKGTDILRPNLPISALGNVPNPLPTDVPFIRNAPVFEGAFKPAKEISSPPRTEDSTTRLKLPEVAEMKRPETSAQETPQLPAQETPQLPSFPEETKQGETFGNAFEETVQLFKNLGYTDENLFCTITNKNMNLPREFLELWFTRMNNARLDSPESSNTMFLWSTVQPWNNMRLASPSPPLFTNIRAYIFETTNKPDDGRDDSYFEALSHFITTNDADLLQITGKAHFEDVDPSVVYTLLALLVNPCQLAENPVQTIIKGDVQNPGGQPVEQPTFQAVPAEEWNVPTDNDFIQFTRERVESETEMDVAATSGIKRGKEQLERKSKIKQSKNVDEEMQVEGEEPESGRYIKRTAADIPFPSDQDPRRFRSSRDTLEPNTQDVAEPYTTERRQKPHNNSRVIDQEPNQGVEDKEREEAYLRNLLLRYEEIRKRPYVGEREARIFIGGMKQTDKLKLLQMIAAQSKIKEEKEIPRRPNLPERVNTTTEVPSIDEKGKETAIKIKRETESKNSIPEQQAVAEHKENTQRQNENTKHVQKPIPDGENPWTDVSSKNIIRGRTRAAQRAIERLEPERPNQPQGQVQAPFDKEGPPPNPIPRLKLKSEYEPTSEPQSEPQSENNFESRTSRQRRSRLRNEVSEENIIRTEGIPEGVRVTRSMTKKK